MTPPDNSLPTPPQPAHTADTGREAALHRYRRRPIAFMLHYVRRHGRGHATIIGAIMVAVACNVGISAIIRHLVNGMSEGQQGREAIWVSIVLFCLTIICDNAAWRLAGWTASGVIVRVGGDVRHDLFRYLTGHASTYFAERLSGALAARVSAAAAAVESLENMAAWNLLPAGLNLLLAIATLGTVSPWMALALVAMTMGVGFVIYRLAGRGQGLHLSYAREAAEVDGEMLDVVQNLPLVRAYGMIGAEHARMRQRIGGETGMHTRSLRYMEKLRMIHSFVTAFMTTGLLVWAVLLWRMHRATTGDVVMVTTLGFLILNCTRDFAFSMVEAMKHVTRLAETLDHLLAPHERSGVAETVMLSPAGGRGHVRLRDVSFAYPGGAPVLSHFNLDIPAGARIGLVGVSGSGKSTVLALLQRQRFVQEGAVEIDGVNILELDDASLRASMAVVPQDVYLLRRSVRENIRYGRPDATEAEVTAAAEAAGCASFIAAMPAGFDTIVGERGVMLSGGQRQRIAIARAFLRNAPVLILDEATSALDGESERHVHAALERLMVGRTVIAVAHRLSTLRGFDRIVVMEQGRIAQQGSMAELERVPGPYRDRLLAGARTLPG
ncbi:ABC transporter ATP-binding protein [Komagataeibacter melaceti]|uniref:ABC transporter ATP-binding protein n=1 Tax=Komagataeibacter melaceti TaxID=2766577 RepID=A0A371Z3Y3_9PROT|nr:ABC transporter ATP-binding protein [Komagataeibacter melaceti]RFD21200.1 ABC transporter ATP-binding protein [Komagataeibacter melaceti]